MFSGAKKVIARFRQEKFRVRPARKGDSATQLHSLPYFLYFLYWICNCAITFFSLAMFSVCRRGPASISQVFRAASSTVRIPSARPSTLSLPFQNTAKPALEARWLHVSQLRSQQAAAQRYERPDESLPAYEVNKFDQLIEHNLVHPNVVKAITEGMGHHTMTQVQSMTINQGLQGTDMQVTAARHLFTLLIKSAVLRKQKLVPERPLVSSSLPSRISSEKAPN